MIRIALLVLALAAPAHAACEGRNLLPLMPAADLAAVKAATDAMPYPRGNFWIATQGDRTIHIAGTYHLDDPRHDPVVPALAPAIRAAGILLVEAGPDAEQQLLERIARDPSVMLITEGPTLLEQLPPADWDRVEAALEARQIPGFMAAKFRPWYVTMMLSIPPCGLQQMTAQNGLDHRVMDVAEKAGVPVRSLEPYDTIFTLFDALDGMDQIEMIRTALAMEDRIEDVSVTMADAYFDGENRLIWEFMRVETAKLPGYTPERVAAEFGLMEQLLMTDRNRAWIPVIEDAAADGPVFAAFGALHLPGEDGVLNLLEQAGWTITPWDIGQR